MHNVPVPGHVNMSAADYFHWHTNFYLEQRHIAAFGEKIAKVV